MKPTLALLATVVLASPAARAGEPARVTLDAVVQSLVRDLGADPYDVRERATKTLRWVGQPALDALARAARSDDPEIRVRSREILADVQLGIRPDWPSEAILLIRHYDRQQENQRYSVLQRIAAALGPQATPFIVQRMAEGSNNEANYAFRTLQRMNDERVWRQVIELIQKPKNDYQARALAWARGQSGMAIDALETLANSHIKDLARDEALDKALDDILRTLHAGKHPRAAADAAKLATTAKTDPRPLYLQAEALLALNKDKQALALRETALTLSPDKETPHCLAAELLNRMGRRRLAVREWERIHAIQPNDSPLDIYAYLRLAAAHAASGLFDPAAQFLERALERYAKLKDTAGDDAVAPGTIESLQMEVNRLRQKAAKYPAQAEAAIEDPLPASEVRIALDIAVKGGKLEDLQHALAEVDAQLRVAAEPPGLRLFDVCSATLRYHKAKAQLVLLLHDQPACAPFPFQPKSKEPRVAVHTADCTYLFKLHPTTGEGEHTARFEKDYVVTLRPGAKLRACSDGVLRINGQTHEWEKATAGIHLDRLPESFDIALEATTPSGRRITSHVTLAASEPAIKPLAPKPEPKPKTKPAPKPKTKPAPKPEPKTRPAPKPKAKN